MSQHPSPEWVKPLIYINLNSESGNLVEPKKKTETKPHTAQIPYLLCVAPLGLLVSSSIINILT